jgi:predicted O-methyltransferase YrrM
MHSPFVFDFIRNVLNNESSYHPPADIKKLRKELEKDDTALAIIDLGAGSRTGAVKERTVSQLAKNAVKPKKYGELMYRLVAHYKPFNIVELGTSLGITTAYMATSATEANIYTIEGAPPVAALASWNFQKLGLNNIHTETGNFDDLLPLVLQKLSAVDVAYVDGNHRYEPTVRYFHQFLQKVQNNSILVFDDIHWSGEMEKAWEEIRNHPQVRCSIDLFFMGFVFFRDEFKTRQNHVIRF